MRIEIKGLSELSQRLAQVRAEEIMAGALAAQSQHLAEAVREKLSQPEGTGPHDAPWVRTGALHDSIEATASGLQAAVGSNDPAAAPQEMGTSRIPPRPFLAPAAAAEGEQIARAIGQKVADALGGESMANSGSMNSALIVSSTISQQRPYTSISRNAS